jgi:hypothetical protein
MKKLTHLPTKKLIEKLFPRRVVREVEKDTQPAERKPEPPMPMVQSSSSRRKQ